MKNYYQILGLETTATEEQIKAAYRKLSKKFHPDVNDQDKFFENMFKEVSEAYDTLSDVKKRGEYDSKFARQNSDQNQENPQPKSDFSDEEYARRKAELEKRKAERAAEQQKIEAQQSEQLTTDGKSSSEKKDQLSPAVISRLLKFDFSSLNKYVYLTVILLIISLTALFYFWGVNSCAGPESDNFDSADSLENSILIPVMVPVKGGVRELGAADMFNTSQTAQSVKIADFFIGKFEVTQREWRSVMGSNPATFYGDNLPVESVSWQDVQEYLIKLNQATGEKYRLPTEAEWEFAAAGGNSTANFLYSGSDNPDEVAWYGAESKNQTYPVGQKKPNQLGIYDMSGNVSEWCDDWYRADLATDSTTVREYKVQRGGSCGLIDMNCRVTVRGYASPTYFNRFDGFRICKSK